MSPPAQTALKLLIAGAAALLSAGAGLATAKRELASKADRTSVDTLVSTMRRMERRQERLVCVVIPQDLECPRSGVLVSPIAPAIAPPIAPRGLP